MKKLLILLTIIPINAWPQFYVTNEDYERIKKYQFSDKRTCDPKKVLSSSINLEVDTTYFDGINKKSLDEKTDQRLLCLISISVEANRLGKPKSRPDEKSRNLPTHQKINPNYLVEELIFGPPTKFNLKCDDDGFPSVIIRFKKTASGKLTRSIDFTPHTLDCSTGELDNWLKPRPTWLK